jgi:CubicO group peptidase (beta-lactamase class C family)
MTELESVVQAVEQGLLPVTRDKDQPTTKKDLIQRMADYKVPGISIAFVDQEALAWAKVFGVAQVGTEKPVTQETIFQSGLISKVAAMVALRPVEDGLLYLDADVNDFLRSWKIPESPNIRMRRDGSKFRSPCAAYWHTVSSAE